MNTVTLRLGIKVFHCQTKTEHEKCYSEKCYSDAHSNKLVRGGFSYTNSQDSGSAIMPSNFMSET